MRINLGPLEWHESGLAVPTNLSPSYLTGMVGSSRVGVLRAT